MNEPILLADFQRVERTVFDRRHDRIFVGFS